EQDEMRLKMLEQDLDVRKQEIEGVLKQSQQAVSEAEKLISQLQAEVQQLKAEKEAIEKEKEKDPEPTADIEASVKVAASWLQMMPPETAAEAVKSLANNGKKDFVLELLGHVEDRNVAKILEALNDSDLAGELVNSFPTARRPGLRNR
ncbi:MAG: hypothetical protein KDB27_22620, partial [Planctomycetales bacterium]|nr:hypothetical protein [Planctomycetales bacterium]